MIAGDRFDLKLIKKHQSNPHIDYTSYEASSYLQPFLKNQRHYQDKYQVGKFLGHGAYAIVKVGYDKVTGERVALKVISIRGSSRNAIQRYITEADIMMQLNHRNILGVKHVMLNESNITIVSERMHMNLLDYMNMRYNKFTEAEILNIFT